MDVLHYLEVKRQTCEENAQDQKRLGNDESAKWWEGRAISFQEVHGALSSGIVTKDGTVKLDLSQLM